MNLLSLGMQSWLVFIGPDLLLSFSQGLWVKKNAGNLSLRFWSYRNREAPSQICYPVREEIYYSPKSILVDDYIMMEECICFPNIWVLINFIPHLLNLLKTGEENIAVIFRIIYWLSWKEFHLLCNLTFTHLTFGFQLYIHLGALSFQMKESLHLIKNILFVFILFSISVFETCLPVSMIASYQSFSFVYS